MVSMLAAALKASSIHFTMGGWEFGPSSQYLVAQMPGLFLLLIANQMPRVNLRSGRQPTWQPPPDLSYHCSGND